MSLTSDQMSPADIAAVTGSNGTWGNEGGAYWLLILFLFMFMGWGGGMWNNGGNGGPNGGPAPYMVGAATQADVQNGFDHAAVVNGLTGINSTLNTGFSNAEVSRCNQQANVLQQMNANNAAVLSQMNDNSAATLAQLNNNNSAVLGQLNQMAYNQLAYSNANSAGLADLKYNIATENCADRNALTQSLMTLQAENRQNTQAILDKMCQQEIEQKNDTINQLRQQLNLANLAASQNQQTGQLMNDNAMQTQSLVNQLKTPSPVPAYIVGNPYCNCGNNYASGCCGG